MLAEGQQCGTVGDLLWRDGESPRAASMIVVRHCGQESPLLLPR